MATIENRNGKYRVKVRLQGVSKSKTFLRHADAKAWAAKMEAQIMDGVQANTPRHLFFADVLTRYRDEIVSKNRGGDKEALRINRILKTPLAKVFVSELMPLHFAKWRDNRLTEVSEASVLREITTLSAACTHAMKEWGYIIDNPVHKISKPKSPKSRDRRPTEEELDRLSLALGYDNEVILDTISKRVGAAMWFAIFTAMRAGEICGLKWTDIDFDRRIAFLEQTKNGHSRDVPLSNKALDILRRLEQIKNGDSVFQLDNGTRDVLFRRARDLCGIDDLHFHDLRREALTRMAGKVPVEMLAKISGHRDLRILLNTYYSPDMADVGRLLD
ncbi:MAG: site-specific integrase [Neisseria sp.]|uniref:tyrosine-type recombinase/integrase n=1 Tax=Neisseria sp. TaxID=192066 RepID=UPI0026DBDCA0|nr:site-specific integrase [Neisseria sp.]MDO4642203.1 site-specific integrase [Neisseria sp.]